MIKTLQTYVVMLLAMLGYGINAGAAAVELPGNGSAVDWSLSTPVSATVENGGANVGSTGASTVVTFTLNNAEAQGYIMTFYTGTKDAATLNVSISAGGETCLDETVTVSSTGGWDCSEKHVLLIKNLPAGESTLTFKVTNATGKYAGNWGNLTFASTKDYDECPGTLSLAKGEYVNGIRTENNNDNVGWITSGCTAAYTFINWEDAVYNLVMPMLLNMSDGKMTVEVTDEATGVVEAKSTFEWTKSASGSYDDQTILLKGLMTKGVKKIKMTFENAGSWVCNYKAPSLVKYASRLALVTGVSVDGLSVVEGTDTHWLVNLPKAYADNVTFGVSAISATLTVTAKNAAGEDVAVTDNGDGTYSMPTPEPGTTSVVTVKVAAEGDAAVDQEEWTFALFRIGDISIKSIAIDGMDVAVPEEINTDPFTATISGRTATVMPEVVATLIDGSTVKGTGVLDGTTATYTLAAAVGEDTRTFTLVVEGVHIYEKVAADKSVELKYTNAGKIENNWTNGTYTLETTSLDGWDFNGGFKWNAAVNTWRVPENIVVKQLIFREFGANYNDGVLESVTSDGATAILPTNNAYIKGAKATMVVNLVGHKAGTPVVFTLTGGGQPYGWCELTVEEVSTEVGGEGDYTITYYKEAYTTDDATYTVFTTQPYSKDATVKLPTGAPTAPEGMMLSHWAQKDGTKLNEGDALTGDLAVYPVWTAKILTLSTAAKVSVTNDDVTARDKCVAKGTQLIDSSYDGAYIEFSAYVKDAAYYTFTSNIGTKQDNIECTLGYLNADGVYVVSEKVAIDNNGSWSGGKDYKWLFELKGDTTYKFRMTCHTPSGYCLNAYTLTAEQFVPDTELINVKVNGMRYFADAEGKYNINVTEGTNPVVLPVTSSTLATVTMKAAVDGADIAIAEDGTIDLAAVEKGKTVAVTATVTDGPVAVDHSINLVVTDLLVRELRGKTEADGSWKNIYNSDMVQEWTDNVFTLTPTEASGRLSNGYWTPVDGQQIFGFCTQNSEITVKAPDAYQIAGIAFIGHTLYGKETRFTVTGDGVTATPESAALSENASAGYMECASLVIDGHKAGTPLTVKVSDNFANMYIRIEYRQMPDNTKPVLESQSIADGATIDYTSGCVSLKFSEVVSLTAEAEATFDGKTVSPKVEDNVCVNYHFIGVPYSSEHTYVLKAGSVADEAGNKYDEDITVKFSVGPRPTVKKKTFDFVVGIDGTIDEAIAAANAATGSERYHIFVPNGTYKLSGTSADHMTDVTRSNISITGQNMEASVLTNEPESYGISTTATLHLKYTENIYMQDITLRNLKSEPDGGQNISLYDRGSKSVLHRVKLFGYQDTYVTGSRSYHKDCHIYGGTDYICGGGNMYFDNCTIYNRTSGNVIAAPATDKNLKWGYVFMNCTIMGKDFTLGRPWQNEPRCYYLNTKMETEPTGTGWRNMSDLVTHFYEYNSMDLQGNKHDLTKRGNSPSSTNKYTPVLTDEQAAEFNVYNVLSSTDGWAPELLAEQIAKPAITVQGDVASWTFNDITLCMVVFKDGIYVTNTTESSYTMTEDGVYTFCAVNEMGGLSEASEAINFVVDGIGGVNAAKADNAPVYNVKGMRAPEMKSGQLYIKNGRKVLK